MTADILQLGNILLKNKDTFTGYFSEDLKQRIGVYTEGSKASAPKTTGTWRDGLLEGFVWIDNIYGGFEETHFQNGIKHGPSRSFGPCPKR